MGCDPEQVTGYVDEELPPLALAEVERHLLLCLACATQAADELEVRQRLRTLEFLSRPFVRLATEAS